MRILQVVFLFFSMDLYYTKFSSHDLTRSVSVLPPSEKSLAMFLFGRLRGIWSIHAYKSSNSASSSSFMLSTFSCSSLYLFRVNTYQKERGCLNPWVEKVVCRITWTSLPSRTQLSFVVVVLENFPSMQLVNDTLLTATAQCPKQCFERMHIGVFQRFKFIDSKTWATRLKQLEYLDVFSDFLSQSNRG